MRLLVFTQAVDSDNPVLGFFHSWLLRLSYEFETVTAVCLSKGRYELPDNVRVLSLGKEEGLSKAHYLHRFFKYLWQERNRHDVVLVHMTPVYIVLGGLFWKLEGTKILLWYNHTFGDLLTRIAIWTADVVLYTSSFSFSSRFAKARIMPAGIDSVLFHKNEKATKTPSSILYFGRISPVKKIHHLLQAVRILEKENKGYIVNIIGSPAVPDDVHYLRSLRESSRDLVEKGVVRFADGVASGEAPRIYNENELVVNLTQSGSLDKTILEAMACESMVLISNRSLAGAIPDEFFFQEDDPEDLARKVSRIMELQDTEKREYGRGFRSYVLQNHDLDALVRRLKLLT